MTQNTALPELTIPQMLRRHAQNNGQGIAIRQKRFGIWTPMTWEEYYRTSCYLALGLADLGLSKGGHLGILSENRTEWVLSQVGANILGAVSVGVYPTSPADEIAYVLEHADVEFIVCEDQEQTDKVIESWDRLPKMRKVLVLEKKGFRSYPADKVVLFEDVIARGKELSDSRLADLEAALDQQSLEDVGLMIYTSGSTGRPKGAMISYRNMRAQGEVVIRSLSVRPDYKYLSYLPLCHVAEQLLTMYGAIYTGYQVNFGESIRTVQEDVREVAPDFFLGVPRIWEKLQSAVHIKMVEAGSLRLKLYQAALAQCEPFATKAPSERTLIEKLKFQICYWAFFRALQNFVGLRKAKIALSGAAAISPSVLTFFRTIGLPVVEAYGQTESTGIVTVQSLDDLRPGTVGAAVYGVDLKADPETGELLVRSDLVFPGYYKNEEATRNTVVDGWLHTGDVVRIEDGQVRIVDRLKDIMITAGGKNLSPTEIENTMKDSPYIKECIVIGEKRKFVSALIQIDLETVGQWAEGQNITYTNFRNLTENPDVLSLIQKEVSVGNSKMATVANIRKFHLLTKELDHDDGEVTATMKVKRQSITDKYMAEIEAMYGA
ncbi:AMP-dependent synthetase/ligase [Sneathiella chinensis]|uniref:Long-chain-fatty-acid--CoA ligase n=1 Tax=Sneathiella chinensis TaxID=349750 RepID=A0ABQ5U1A0_9PROT|nr:AMP-binding protein [Sneathiella chinensis]GLQ05079.1 long-chain-fatty-acid--CoA ligase [Sneathiella chinensis]